MVVKTRKALYKYSSFTIVGLSQSDFHCKIIMSQTIHNNDIIATPMKNQGRGGGFCVVMLSVN